MTSHQPVLPSLAYDSWTDTRKTLHLYSQIIGKVRMKLMPYKNHWWHATLYVNARGLGTGPISCGDKLIEIDFDFIDHRLIITSSKDETLSFELANGLCVADFYARVFEALKQMDVEVKILARPYEIEGSIPFAEDRTNCTYDREYVERFWKILAFISGVFKEFGGRFIGKCSPVHLFWHSFDLAMARFSGKRAPEMPEANQSNKEAYSHEEISAGFWAGDKNVPEPAFYSYTYPSPEGIDNEPLMPAGKAKWILSNGSPMALYRYEDLLTEPDPKEALLQFLESSYRAGAKLAKWDVEKLERKV